MKLAKGWNQRPVFLLTAMLWSSAAPKFMLPVVGPDFAPTDIRQAKKKKG
jgi:hypothetical protein